MEGLMDGRRTGDVVNDIELGVMVLVVLA